MLKKLSHIFDIVKRNQKSTFIVIVTISSAIFLTRRFFMATKRRTSGNNSHDSAKSLKMTYDFEKSLVPNGFKFRIKKSSSEPERFTFQDFIDKLKTKDEAFLRDFTNTFVNENDFKSLYFECPPIIDGDFTRPFEFVLIESKSLHLREPDKMAFEEHFKETEKVVVFQNLGGDSTLIAPCPPQKSSSFKVPRSKDSKGLKQFAHIASFMRDEESPIKELWQKVGEELENKKNGKVWLSTSGDGISWLHVRLDSRPKYYQHEEYKRP